jgi:beta-glucosidase
MKASIDKIIGGIGIALLLMSGSPKQPESRIHRLLNQMSLDEKIGQLSQMHSENGSNNPNLLQMIREGRMGSVLNEANTHHINEMQRVAVEESRLGIPLIFARDVIHGFHTIFPINIGLAATFNPELVQQGAEVWAREARTAGIRWSFGPMLDVSRDPRWGRMAEGFGEDVHLVTQMGLATLKGFQTYSPDGKLNMAACAKHFAGYGAVEGGRDYNTVSVSPSDLYNIHLAPFKALVDNDVQTVMSSFTEVNGVPASGNKMLLTDILRNQWKFKGFVVSDWASVHEQIYHGYAANDKEAARLSFSAGLDVEMATSTYAQYLKELIDEKKITMAQVDESVLRVLELKEKLGLFENPYVDAAAYYNKTEHLALAKKAAVQSLVLLKNENKILPLSPKMGRIGVVGPMANDVYEQLGTWIFDGDTNLTITPLAALNEFLGEEKVSYSKILKTTRDKDLSLMPNAIQKLKDIDVVLVFAGEEAILTGEAHSRAFLDLPGAQNQLIQQLKEAGKKVILVVMTSRPLTLGSILPYADAVIYAWHPGSMGGPAIVDVLFGIESPSGKLPITFPKSPGQIPIYYAHKNSGRPANSQSFVHLDSIPVRSFQTSLGNTNHYLDVGFEPLFPFGFGLSYTNFSYGEIELSAKKMNQDETLKASLNITNTGTYPADEIVQLYIQDISASFTRPVKELKAFRRVHLKPGESQKVSFEITSSQLSFLSPEGEEILESGQFNIWIGPHSNTTNKTDFQLETSNK